MTLKEELEILRGEPIEVFEGDPMDIPCIETSDSEKLCKHPVVSVHMITYNHEPYIRQAIEGVMMQKTDFEFELVIGEDCSQDKTREICFEYQKRYPDKIRVLWWHENVSKLGGNSRRVTAHCRGEFIALCEGDDYWIDPLKLQKQVDYIRETGSVMCVANSEWHYPNGEIQKEEYKAERCLLTLQDVLGYYFHTTTYLINRDAYLKCKKRYSEMIVWYDCVVIACMRTMGSVCFLPDNVSVYNWTGSGISGSIGSAKRDMILAFQYVQFTYCSNQVIANYYAPKAISFLSDTVAFGVNANGYRHASDVRRRAWRVARDVCRMHYGRKAELLFSASYFKRVVRARMLSFYIKHPSIGVVWRKVKSVCVRHKQFCSSPKQSLN